MLSARSLTELRDAMAGVRQRHGGDQEAAHVEADELLVATVMRLASTHGADVMEVTQEILEHYVEIPKWYA